MRNVLKELGWMKVDDELTDGVGLWVHSSEYVAGADEIDVIRLGVGVIVFESPNLVNANTFNPADGEEKFREWIRRCRNGEADLPLDDSGAYPDSETDPMDEAEALDAEGQELQYLERHGL